MKRNAKRLAVGIVIVVTLLILLFGFVNLPYVPITGYFLYDSDNESVSENGVDSFENENNDYNNVDDESDVIIENNEVMIDENKDEDEIEVDGGSYYKDPMSSGGGGYISEDVIGYRIFNLNEGLDLWTNGFFINENDLFNGVLKFRLYKESERISEFTINVNRNINLANLSADSNDSISKAFIHTDLDEMSDVILYVPRTSEQNKVRVCVNASDFSEIFEGCSGLASVSREYVLELGVDDDLNLSDDEKYFIIKNISGTGALSFGNVSYNKSDVYVYLVSPKDNSGDYGNNTEFNYKVSSVNDIKECKLLIDDEIILSSNSILLNDNVNTFIVDEVILGKHYWNVICEDVIVNVKTSEKRKIFILENGSYDFHGNISDVDFEKVLNFSIRSSGFGLISFLVPINLSNSDNISDYVVIRKNFISIDSENIPELNKPAILTFYGLEIENPVILKNGEVCKDCEVIGYENGELIFKVNSFSNYSATENSQLEIWDDSDKLFKVSGNLSFYANYTDISDDTPITGATCEINFSDMNGFMTYNAGLGLYIFNRTITNGITWYNISCDHGSYTAINLSDYASYGKSLKGPFGANISDYGNDTYSGLVSSDGLNSNATFLSNIDVETISVTNSWQGYYGNVSGTIQLGDSNNNILYNWTVNSPTGEVYATRAFDVNFISIGCASEGEMDNENVYVGAEQNSLDSVYKTFNEKSHPEFYVGGVKIDTNTCNSTNLFDDIGDKSSGFYEVMLADDASNIIYTAILENDIDGFDGKTYDFEMIVGENGRNGDNQLTKYYFYIEVQ